MARIKIVLRKEQKKDGTYPLAIKIFKDKKASYIYLDYSIKPEQWDGVRVKSSHPNAKRMNNYLMKKLSEANDKSLELETAKPEASLKAVRQKIKPTGGDTFFGQSDLYLSNLKSSGKYNQYTADKPRLKHFKEFIGGDIAFSDITPTMLDRFRAYLKGGGDHGERSAVNHLVAIRSVFSRAIKDNVVDPKHYPFGKGKTPIKFPESKKVGLTREEVKKLEDVELTDKENHTRNLWLFSFYTAGMRISDVLRLRRNEIRDGRLNYTMGKNNKGVSIKLPEKAKSIIEQYQENKDLVFPDLKDCDFNNVFETQRTIAFKTSAHDKVLRNSIAGKVGIDKKLTMHIARHTFAQNATDVDVRVLQRLFRHTKLETTEGYMGNFITDEADKAIDLVIG